MSGTDSTITENDAASRGKGDLTSGPVNRRFVELWLPMIGGIFAVKVIGLSDAYFVGQLGEQPLAAISFTFPLVMMLITLAIGLSSGASSVLSRAVGERADASRQREVVAATLSLALLLALLLGGLGYLLIEDVIWLLGARGASLEDATLYMKIWFSGIVFLILPIAANGLLRATGDGMTPAILMSIIAVLNVALNPALIFGFGPIDGFGMQGAAVATVTARATATVLILLILWRRDLICRDLKIVFRAVGLWKRILRIGMPAAVSTSANPIALSLATAAIALLGEASVAAFGAATKIQSIAIVPLLALSAASAPFAGQNSAAEKTQRTRAMLYWCAAISLAWSALTAIIFLVFGDIFASLFSTSDSVAQNIKFYLLVVPFSLVGYGIVISLSAALNGIGRPLIALSLTASRALLLLAPLVWIGAIAGGFNAAVTGIAAANLVSGGVAFFLISRFALETDDPEDGRDYSEGE